MSKLYIKDSRKALDDVADEEALGQERVNDYFDQSSEERHCKPITKLLYRSTMHSYEYISQTESK